MFIKVKYKKLVETKQQDHTRDHNSEKIQPTSVFPTTIMQCYMFNKI